jgi:hypothetical protein
MANVRKGQLLVAADWAKHLRAFGKKHFWRRHRRVEKRVVRSEIKTAKEMVNG